MTRDALYDPKDEQVIAMVGALTVAGCGKKEESGGGAKAAAAPKVVASCDLRAVPMASLKSCLEYVGSVWTKKEVQARCGLEGQVFIDGPCPSEGVVFTCVQEAGKPMEAVNRYYANPEKAKKVCADIGRRADESLHPDTELTSVALEAALAGVQAHQRALGDREANRRHLVDEWTDHLAVPGVRVSDVERRSPGVVLPHHAESLEGELDES